jgi:arylformamidase
VAALALALLASGCAGEATTRRAAGSSVRGSCNTSGAVATVAYREVAGVDRNLTSLDVHPVAGVCGAPVVMWVHGGGYRIGDKANQIRDKVALFGGKGWVLVSVNYRLTRPGQANSAQFPDHFDDVAAAVAWVHSNIAAYGGDPSRIALLGHSAGADIVANVATNPAYLEQHGLGLSALRCAGPLDTEGFDKTRAGASDPTGEREQWRSALGNNPNYLTETSATGLVKAGIGIPPMIGVVRGTPRRQQIEAAFLDTVRAAGIEATTIDARSLTHSEVNTKIGAPGDTVMTAPMVAFLGGCFR